MKKIVLGLVVTSSLIIASQEGISEEELKARIVEAKAEKKAIIDKINSLQSQLPYTKLVARAELGLMQTKGNTNTDTFNLDLNVKKGWSRLHLVEFSIDAQYATDDNVETKNKYTTELGYSYLLTSRLSATYLFGFKQDKFSGYNYQLYTGPGLKYTFIKKENHKLTFEGSVLFSEDSVEDTEYDATGATISYPNPDNIAVARVENGEIDRYGSYRIKGVYGWQVFSNLKFDQDISYRSEIEDSSVFFVTSKSALSSKFNSTFSAGISYKVDYVNSPPEGKKNTDKTFTVNVIMDY
ncbi:hypothetical protein M947_08005 [Sulfurimonas hongkongensis]|uniref:Salt-induced outer membrane protein n=1 Tax=Sulfurimonas hongkongensis TaxID=1172190 RepID=T0JDL8_9BACT|nr:DUF481 domain-containing protein [Sulfurimonas hongkongensis]EQB39095.1 hypothetical protein M947_08005 [Sulfurimonas hongkongensis]